MEYGGDDFRSALDRMRREFGPEIFQNPKRMTAILRDLAPGREAECNALRQLAERGLLAELEAASGADDARRQRVMMKLRVCLTDYLQLSEERTEYYVSLLLDLCGIARTETLTGAGRQGNLTWTLDENGVLTVSGAGDMRDYQFASDAVNSPWWERRAEIVSVRVGDGVTAIGDSAFYGCEALETVELPESAVRIGEWAFAGCPRLDGVTLPQSLRRIDRGAFSDCDALSEIDIPDGVRVIESWTFRHCPRLRRVSFPESVASIGQRAFEGCTLLSHALIPSGAWVEDTAFDPSVIITRPAPPELSAPPSTPPVGFALDAAALRTLSLPLFALTVILRHGAFALPLLLAPVGLLLLRKEW